jgi:Mg-chelatase subunit ChlD
LNTGTATRNEKDRVLSLNAKLSKLKKEIKVSKERETVSEMKMLHSVTRTKVTQIQTAMKEKDIRSAIRAVCAAESVDLVFIVDCTGSMTSYIASVKQNMIDIVRRISLTSGNLRLRMALVGYRGVRDMHHPSNLSVLDFVSSVHEFEDFLGRISTWGGDGSTADMARGIQTANQLSWKQSTRVAFLIADVPCHGSEFHPRSDSYPNGTPGIDIKAELKTMFANSESGTMTVHFGRITVETDQMIRRFKECGIPIDVVGIEDISKVAGSVTRSVRTSIFKTMTVSGGAGKSVAFAPVVDVESLLKSKSGVTTTAVSLKDYRIHDKIPSANGWMRREAVSVKVYRNHTIKSVANYRHLLESAYSIFSWSHQCDSSRPCLCRAANPFAEGEIRIAYHSALAPEKV